MGRVRARVDIRSVKGLLIAPSGKFGVAILHSRSKLNKQNYGKVPVRWNGRRKIYWVLKNDLEFINPKVDPDLYVARSPERIYPAMPTAPESFSYNFGANVRHFRKMRKLKQWELAARVSELLRQPVSQTTVSYWERNESPPRGAYLNAISVALNIPAFIFLLDMDDCCWLEEASSYMQKLTDKTCEEEPF